MSIKYNGKLIAGKYKTQIVTDATESNKGLIRIATLEEVNTGTDNTTAVTPKGLATKQNKLTAGTGIEILPDGTINNTQTSAEWGNITGTITDQLDLQTELNKRVDKVEGKSLIEDAEIERLKTLKNYDDTQIKTDITNINSVLETKASTTDLENGLKTKQDKLTFDTTPTANSSNPVTSDGIKNELDKKVNSTTLTTELAKKQNKLTAGTGIKIENNTISNTQTSAEWGNIKGNLSSQTDLQNALNNRADKDLSNLSTAGESKLNNLTANLANKSLTNLNTQGQLYIGKQALMSWSSPADTTGTKAFKLAEMTDAGGNNHPMGLFRWSYITSDARCYSFDILVGLEIRNGNISHQRLNIINHYGVTELRSEALKILKENFKMLYKIVNTNKPVIELWQKIPVNSLYRSIKLERLYSTHGDYGNSNTDVWVMYNKSGAPSSFTTYSETGYSVITPTEAFIHQDKLTAGENIKIEGNVISSTSLGNKNITNCLLEVPQRIKYTLENGTLTIKAGSVVIVPYGTEDLTAQYPVGATFINDNFKVYDTQFANGKFFVWAELKGNIVSPQEACPDTLVRPCEISIGENKIIHKGKTTSTTEAITTSCVNYNTNTNLVNDHDNSGAVTDQVLSLPLLNVQADGTTIQASITQTFNGMGYIGSTAWVDKGVKGLIPNGRNADGTLNNIEYTNNKISIYTFTGGYADTFYLRLSSTGTLLNHSTQLRYNIKSFSDAPTPTVGKWYSVYVEDENMFYYSNNGGAYYEDSAVDLGIYSTSADNKITSLNPKLPFRAVDYGDIWYDSSTQTLHIGG